MNLCDNIAVGGQGHLTFAGQDTTALAKEYGTPLYLLDEDRIRRNCRVYRQAFRQAFGENALPLYAGKANAFRRIYQIMTEEGMGLDVVSAGEICTAAAAGYDLSKAYFHSNNKTDEDISYAMEHGVGYFVADCAEEVLQVESEAARRGLRQKLLLRVTPGIDPHTYEAVNTGMVDSKFGSAIETGQAKAITALTLRQEHIELAGFHCHVGSQVFDEDVFLRTVVVMMGFLAEIRRDLGYTASQLDLGGGYGVRYKDDEPTLDLAEKIREVGGVLRAECRRLDFPLPTILMEPGRIIVADAGMTLYTVGSVKRIPGYKNYISIDGGMTDNPRYALYGARYTCLPAGKMNEPCAMSADLVGRCCESGDVIQPDVAMPESIRRGDLVAVCTTGAYNYSMASNYNRIPRPPIVMLCGGRSYVAVRRETLEDLIALDQ